MSRCSIAVTSGLFWSMVAFAVASASAAGRDRFQAGALKGFTRSPTEHVINEVDDVIQVRRVEGFIILAGGYSEPMANVLFEIRGPGASPAVKGVTTDDAGHFRLKHLSPGTYKFKVTLNGFQSVIGTIIVDKKAAFKPIRIELHVGV